MHTIVALGRTCTTTLRAKKRFPSCSSLLTPHSSLLTPHSSLLTPHRSPLTAHRSPLAAQYTYCSLLTAMPSRRRWRGGPVRKRGHVRSDWADQRNLSVILYCCGVYGTAHLLGSASDRIRSFGQGDQESRSHAVPCHAMPCRGMPCRAVPCRAVPSHALSAMPCHAMPFHAMPCHAMPCHVIPLNPPLPITSQPTPPPLHPTPPHPISTPPPPHPAGDHEPCLCL